MEKLVYVGLFVGTIGQSVWCLVFWNSSNFMGHWYVALIGFLIAVIGTPKMARKLTDKILNS